MIAFKKIYAVHKSYDGIRPNETLEYGNPSFNVYMYVKVFFNTKTCDDDIKATTSPVTQAYKQPSATLHVHENV